MFMYFQCICLKLLIWHGQLWKLCQCEEGQASDPCQCCYLDVKCRIKMLYYVSPKNSCLLRFFALCIGWDSDLMTTPSSSFSSYCTCTSCVPCCSHRLDKNKTWMCQRIRSFLCTFTRLFTQMSFPTCSLSHFKNYMQPKIIWSYCG